MKDDLLYLLIIFNIIGFTAGMVFFYAPQIAVTNPLLWVFTPDCPLAALFFVMSAVLLLLKKRNNTLFILSFAAGLKYSTWTWFVTLAFWGYYVTPANLGTNIINLIAHVALAVEQLLLLGKFKPTKKSSLIAGSYLLANDLSDYLLMTHPALPAGSLSFMFSFTLSLTIGSLLVTYLVSKRSL